MSKSSEAAKQWWANATPEQREARSKAMARGHWGEPEHHDQKCLYCGEVMDLPPWDFARGRIFCSRRCAGLGRPQRIEKARELLREKIRKEGHWRDARVLVKCLDCGGSMLLSPSHVGRRKFCSKLCYQRNKKAQERIQDPEAANRKGREFTRKLRLEMLIAYGGKCTCCGESHEEFMQLDHIGGRTSENHPWTVKAGAGVYAKLKKMGWPKDLYRLLCANCNWAIRFSKICPHEAER